MKRCAELTAKSLSLFKKASFKGKKNLKAISIGTTFLVCGFFYSFFFHQNSPADPNFPAEKSTFFEKISAKTFPVAYAKTESQKEEKIPSFCNSDFIEKNSSKLQIELSPSFCEKTPLVSTEQSVLEENLRKEQEKEKKQEKLKIELLEILQDTPMEQMIDPLLEQDKTVAALLVGIAFKESKFGEFSPKKNGRECFNYWGFKGKTNPTNSGYSCFSDPKEAIEVVGKRLKELSVDAGRTKPAQLTVWKCGSSCAAHAPGSVQKWIADVSIFYNKIEAIKI